MICERHFFIGLRRLHRLSIQRGRDEVEIDRDRGVRGHEDGLVKISNTRHEPIACLLALPCLPHNYLTSHPDTFPPLLNIQSVPIVAVII
jgi:hypothetical protein